MSLEKPQAGGKFIVLEGIDGSGTTTQLERLALALEAQGRRVHRTCEPTSFEVGTLIRALLQGRGGPARHPATMALLFAADRLDHLEQTVLPRLRQGDVVISDRYTLSSLAYQSLTSEEADAVEWLQQLNRHAIVPDLTLVLDVSPNVAEARRRARGGPEELFEKSELQRRLAALYASAETLVVGHPLLHISADGDADAVASQVESAVRPLFSQ
jgi:dTMP kinase